MSTSNPSLSPLGDLGKLPAELRNEIYRLALTTSSHVEVSRSRKKLPDNGTKSTSASAIKTTERHEFGLRSRVKIAPAKRNGKRNFAVSQLLAVNLLRASKSIAAEATPIFYSLNHFDFESVHAVEPFITAIGKNCTMLAHVSFSYRAAHDVIRSFSCMADPKSVTIRFDTGWARAGLSARFTWTALKPIVTTQRCYGAPGQEWLVIDLPEELQVKRFRAFEFCIYPGMEFETAAGDGKCQTINDDGERARRYKALVHELLTAQAKRDQEAKALQDQLKAMKDELLAEKLHASRKFR